MSAGRKAKDPLDRYDTPTANTRHLLKAWRKRIAPGTRILEPAAGSGQIVEALRAWYPLAKVIAADVEPRAPGVTTRDFLRLDNRQARRYGLVITNPPFRLAEHFLRRAMQTVTEGGFVVFLLPAAFLESKRRENLLEQYPPREVFFLRSRPHFTGPNSKRGKGDSVMYAWFVWQEGKRPRTFRGRVI